MSDKPIQEQTLGQYLQEVLAPYGIDVTIVPIPEKEDAAFQEHLSVTPTNQIDLSQLRQHITHYYGLQDHSVAVAESDGRHFKLKCVAGPVELEVNCCYNFEGDESYEITVA